VALYILALYFFVPRLGKVARVQADARSLMTGRITDAYTNIATVKLFSHARREAFFARSAMQEFLGTVHTQMRLVTGFEIVNHVLSMALIAASAGATLWLWTQGEASVGAVAAATAMALRLNGISHWVMWEMATCSSISAPCRTASTSSRTGTRWSTRPRRSRSPLRTATSASKR